VTNVHEEAVASDFATNLRRATWSDHEAAEFGKFMQALLTSKLSQEQYGALTEQLYFIYVALEAAVPTWENDPTYGVFVDRALDRVKPIEEDLAFYYGDDWKNKIKALPATEAYVARINEVAQTSGALFMAHHYLRYLGDLSGGVDMRKVGEAKYGLNGPGIRFYQFPGITDGRQWKVNYRDNLNGLKISEEEQQAVIDEVANAYRLNVAMFTELGAAQKVA
jgi:heme oxygenase